MIGIIENGNFKKAKLTSTKIRINGRVIYNPKKEDYFANGYKEVKETAEPKIKDGFYSVPKYEDKGDFILQTWVVEEYVEEEM